LADRTHSTTGESEEMFQAVRTARELYPKATLTGFVALAKAQQDQWVTDVKDI
jgi:L-rhamnose isomerase